LGRLYVLHGDGVRADALLIRVDWIFTDATKDRLRSELGLQVSPLRETVKLSRSGRNDNS
jgi:hypothetical protein